MGVPRSAPVTPEPEHAAAALARPGQRRRHHVGATVEHREVARGAELTSVRDNLRHASLSTTSICLHGDEVKRARQLR